MAAEPGWKCKLCRQMQTRHNELLGFFYCNDGKAAVFERLVTRPTRRSASFDTEELELLHFIVAGCLQDRDVTAAARHPKFINLATKITKMRQKSKAAAEAMA